jgi:type I pantothenate kinase
MEPSGVELVARLVVDRGARLVAITGGVAAGKSTFAAALAEALPSAVVVGSDGFLHPNAVLSERGLSDRKGFPESFDGDALGRFLDAVASRAADAAAPVYSHLAYDVVDGDRVLVGDAEVVIVEGLHLASPALGVRSRLDLVVHLDAEDVDLERWYLERFRTLRTVAADDPSAFLHQYLGMGGDALDGMALDVWRAVNLVVLHEHARPDAVHADVVLHLDAEHGVLRAEGP